MTDNRWDTLQEKAEQLEQWAADGDGWGAYSASVLADLEVALASLKADYEALTKENRRIQDVLNREVTAYAELEANLERIEGERDRAIALLEEWQPKVVRTGGPQTLPGRTAAFLRSTAALGHTTEGAPKNVEGVAEPPESLSATVSRAPSTTCPTCGSGDPFGMLPGCQHAPTRDPWHGHTTEGAPK